MTRILRLHRHLDWHAIETEPLRTTTDSHEIEFSKTQVNSYTHLIRQGINIANFLVEIVNISDRHQRVALVEANHPNLAKIFDDISERIN